ncbi:hypothetical protein FA04_27670 (plasmid) [Ensifer adhaerens]|nr:hypothetical protein FA04_27670 [Ensifer adhaerens]KDP74008.1 hypothetical protein FA04_08755 [Ensifer adhaerens]KQX02935.1 hypothetical protein ASD01_16705 [Ensifer sp. Root423]
MGLEHLGEIALRIGEVLTGKGDDLLGAKVLDVDLASNRKCARLFDRQQIALVRDRKEAQGPDVFDRTDEAEIYLAVLQSANDVAGRAARHMKHHIGKLTADTR